MATGGGPGVLGKGRAGSGSWPAETDDTQPGGKGRTTTTLKSNSSKNTWIFGTSLNAIMLSTLYRDITQNAPLNHSLFYVYQVDLNPALPPVYTQCLRLCGNWLAETCLESPGVILEKYLERVRGPLCSWRTANRHIKHEISMNRERGVELGLMFINVVVSMNVTFGIRPVDQQ